MKKIFDLLYFVAALYFLAMGKNATIYQCGGLAFLWLAASFFWGKSFGKDRGPLFNFFCGAMGTSILLLLASAGHWLVLYSKGITSLTTPEIALFIIGAVPAVIGFILFFAGKSFIPKEPDE